MEDVSNLSFDLPQKYMTQHHFRIALYVKNMILYEQRHTGSMKDLSELATRCGVGS